MANLSELNGFIQDFEDKLISLYSSMRKEIYYEIYGRKEYKTQYNERLKVLFDKTPNEKLEQMIKVNLPLINRIFKTKITVTGKCLDYESSVITVHFYHNKNSHTRFNYDFHESDFNK